MNAVKIRELPGTDLPIAIYLKPMGTVHLEDCDFTCEFYPMQKDIEFLDKAIRFTKEQMTKESQDTYVAFLRTSSFVPGIIMCKMILSIPDERGPNGMRESNLKFSTGTMLY